MADTKMEAAIFIESFLPIALRRALDYAGDDGFVASMPQRSRRAMHQRVCDICRSRLERNFGSNWNR